MISLGWLAVLGSQECLREMGFLLGTEHREPMYAVFVVIERSWDGK